MKAPVPGARLSELCALMERLLAPDGCPWDRAQTLETLKPFLVEETYEVLEAMDGAAREHCEELGDLLFQVVFQSALRARQPGGFGIDDVVGAICEKMYRRHPHVFGTGPAAEALRGDLEAVHAQWVQQKAAERREKGQKTPSALDGVPKSAPALLVAWRLTEKASRVGFDWPDATGPRAKVSEELAELDAALASGDHAHIKDELGDLLFAAVNLARKLDLDPEDALRGATRKFEARFREVEARLEALGRPAGTATLAEMDAAWDAAKRSGR